MVGWLWKKNSGRWTYKFRVAKDDPDTKVKRKWTTFIIFIFIFLRWFLERKSTMGIIEFNPVIGIKHYYVGKQNAGARLFIRFLLIVFEFARTRTVFTVIFIIIIFFCVFFYT